MSARLNSSWTGRAPRTMADAFNPHVDNRLQPMPDERDYSVSWWAWMVACAAVAVFLIFSTR